MDRRKDLEETVDNGKKIINTCEEIINKAQKKISELKKDKKEQWIPEYGEKYWYYDKDNEVVLCDNWADTNTDKMRLENKVIFETEEAAERYAEYQKAKKEYTYDFSVEEWKDIDMNKYIICYQGRELNIDVYSITKICGCNYFKTKERAQEFIDKYKDEILEYEFEIKK